MKTAMIGSTLDGTLEEEIRLLRAELRARDEEVDFLTRIISELCQALRNRETELRVWRRVAHAMAALVDDDANVPRATKLSL